MRTYATEGFTREDKEKLFSSLEGHEVSLTLLVRRSYPVYEMGQPTGQTRAVEEKLMLHGTLERVESRPGSRQPDQWVVRGESYRLSARDRVMSVIDYGTPV